MENSEQIINGGYHIKVNKKQKSKNSPVNRLLDDAAFFNDSPQTRNYINSQIQNDKNNNNYPQNGMDNNYFTEGNYPSSVTHKEFKYHKININKKLNKDNNKQNYTSLNNKKYKKKFIDDENGKKNLIYKSETQYPLNKKESLGENDNKSMKNLNYSPIIKNSSLKHFNISKKHNINERTEVRNKKYFLYNYEHNTYKKESKKKIEKYSNLTFNKLRHNFYKPLKKPVNDDVIKKENINTEYPQKNENKNIPSYSNTINNSRNVKRKGNFSNMNNLNKGNNLTDNNCKKNDNKSEIKTINNESDQNKMINIYKNKLVNIFVRLMMNFYINYSKKIFHDLINNLRDNLYNSANYKKYKTKKLMDNDNKRNDVEENRVNYYYIKKNSFKNHLFENNIYNVNKNSNFNINKSLSINKNLSSITMYNNNAIKNKSSIRNQNYYEKKLYIKNNTNIDNIDNIENIENELSKKRSAKNLYIKAKNRNNNYNFLPRQKDSIFNELKINKSSKNFETNNSNIYQNQNINTQINNFYNTNNSNFYINKINSFSSVMTIDKQKPKIFISKNNQKNIESPKNLDMNEQNINIKCAIFKNKKKYNNVIYKKILSNEKNDENKIPKNDKVNVFMKRMERVYNKNKVNKNYVNNINQTYSVKRLSNNNDLNKNQFSTIGNYLNDNNDNNYNNSPEISNDLNNYNLEDIDKPMNMIHMKNNMYIDNDQDNENEYEEENSLNEDIDIKNLIQMITNDKRLYLNFNYVQINKYKTDTYKLKKNFLFMYKINNLFIPGIKKNNIQEDNIDLSNVSIKKNNSYNDTPEKINKNLNKYIKRRKLKSGLLKLDNIINNKIYEYKSIFFDFLKKINLIYIIDNIIQKHVINLLKEYFDIFKNNLKKEKYNKINNKNIILDKKNINYIIEDKKIGDINHLQNKEKLKFLVKQINTNGERNMNLNVNDNIIISSLEEEDNSKIQKDRNNNNIPLWKSMQINKEDINDKKSRNIYLKKNVKLLKENSTYRSSDYKKISNNNKLQHNYYEKIENFRNKLLKFIFYKK